MTIARRTLFSFAAALSLVAVVIANAAAANKQLPVQMNDDQPFPVQIDGTGIYSVSVRERRSRPKTSLYSIRRFDSATGKRKTVYDAGTRPIGEFRVGAGKIVARVAAGVRKVKIISIPLDGSRSTTLTTATWNSERKDGGCGTHLAPNSISPSGDVVVISDPTPCHRTVGKHKYLIFRADGTRTEVGAERSDPDQLDGMNNPIHTQLVGDRLLVSDGTARIYDLSSGAMTLLWLDGVDHALLAQDGSMWLSAFGTANEDAFWSSLLRAASPLDTPAGLASNTGRSEEQSTRYLPLLCGESLLVLRARVSAYADDTNGDVGVYGWYSNLRLGGGLKFTLYSPAGNPIRSLPEAKIEEAASVGCDAGSVTVAGLGRNGPEYKRVTF
jgi:hypothetical protein